MEDKIIIYSADDFFKAFIIGYGFSEETVGREIRYQVAGEYGSGCIKRITFTNGIEICIEDIFLKKSIRMHYKMSKVPFEVSYCISGRIEHFEKEMGNIPLCKGHTGIFMKNESEGWMEYPKDIEIKCISIAVNSNFIDSFCHDQNLEWQKKYYERISSEKVNALMKPQRILPDIKLPFEQMEGCRFEGLTRLMYLECKAIEVVCLALEREVAQPGKINKKVLLNTEDRQKIQLAEKIIMANITKPLSIKELSLRVGLNTCKLKEGFKAVYGNTIFGYIKDVRMEKAKELLLQEDGMNINEIVNEVGYSNTGHFARAFREKYGTNPKKLRLGT